MHDDQSEHLLEKGERLVTLRRGKGGVHTNQFDRASNVNGFYDIERKYTGFVKLKQNWDDALRKTTNPKTLILAGNIESAVK